MAVPKDFHEAMAAKMSGDDGSPDTDDGSDDGYKAAVSSFIEAVESKDVDGAADALESAISLCKPKGADGDEGGGHSALLLIPHGKH